MKPFLHGVIEPSQRVKSCRESNLRDGEMRLNNELPGKIEPVVVMKLLGSLTKFSVEQASHMSGRQTQSIGEGVFRLMFKCALCNELERPLDGGMFAVPGRRSGSRLGTAS